MDVVVAGRVGQERLWDLPERVIPADAPRDELTEDEYEERRVMRAMQRFGVADVHRRSADRAYGLSIPAAKALLGRLVEEGRLVAVDLPYPGKPAPAFALPEALESADSTRVANDPAVAVRSAGLRPRSHRAAVRLQLQARDVQAQGQSASSATSCCRSSTTARWSAGSTQSATARANELVVRKLHWESGKAPSAARAQAVDQAVDELKEFVRGG